MARRSNDEYEEDENEDEEGITSEDIKDGLDIISKGLDIANKYKKLTETKTTPRPPMGIDPPFLPTNDEIEREIKKTKRAWGQNTSSDNRQSVPKRTNYTSIEKRKTRHHFTRSEKIGLAGLAATILGIILYFIL